MADVTTAMVTGITSIASGMTDAIGDIVPVALPVLGAILIVSVGIRLFKRVTGR